MKSLFCSLGGWFLLSISVASSVVGATIKHPPEQPAFSITAPDDWTINQANGKVALKPKATDEFVVEIAPSAWAGNPAAAGKALRSLLEAVAARTKLTEFTAGKPVQLRNNSGIEFSILAGHGQRDASKMVVVATIFTPAPERSYVLTTIGTAIADRKYDGAMKTIVGSIKPER